MTIDTSLTFRCSVGIKRGHDGEVYNRETHIPPCFFICISTHWASLIKTDTHEFIHLQEHLHNKCGIHENPVWVCERIHESPK